MLQANATATRCDDDASEMGEVGQQLRSRHHDVARIIRANIVLKLLPLQLFERLDGEQGIDKQPIAFRCGNASGRRMWAGDIAHFFQIRHHVADRRGREFQSRKF